MMLCPECGQRPTHAETGLNRSASYHCANGHEWEDLTSLMTVGAPPSPPIDPLDHLPHNRPSDGKECHYAPLATEHGALICTKCGWSLAAASPVDRTEAPRDGSERLYWSDRCHFEFPYVVGTASTPIRCGVPRERHDQFQQGPRHDFRAPAPTPSPVEPEGDEPREQVDWDRDTTTLREWLRGGGISAPALCRELRLWLNYLGGQDRGPVAPEGPNGECPTDGCTWAITDECARDGVPSGSWCLRRRVEALTKPLTDEQRLRFEAAAERGLAANRTGPPPAPLVEQRPDDDGTMARFKIVSGLRSENVELRAVVQRLQDERDGLRALFVARRADEEALVLTALDAKDAAWHRGQAHGFVLARLALDVAAASGQGAEPATGGADEGSDR